MLPLPRIHVLIKIGAVEFSQTMRVLWKMSWHPVDDHANPGTMAGVDEMTQFVGISKSTRRRIVIRYLVTPRAFERVFRDRHQLDVGVAHFNDVRQQRLG